MRDVRSTGLTTPFLFRRRRRPVLAGARADAAAARAERRGSRHAWLALALFCAPATAAAAGAFPVWDDGYVWLVIAEHGLEALGRAQPDRPFMAALWAALAPSASAFWIAALLAQALLWPALGILAARLWIRLFPALAAWAPVVACAAVAPHLNRIMVVTVNVALASLLSVVAAYTAVLLLVRWADGAPAARLGLAGSVPLLAFATLLQEYAVPVVAVLWVLLAWRLGSARGPERRRIVVALLLSGAVTGLAYLAYLRLGDLAVRPEILPTLPMTQGAGAYARLPLRLATAVGRGLLGALAGALGSVNWTSIPGLVASGYGLLAAGFLVRGLGFSGERPVDPGRAPGAGVLLAALVAALLPVLVMGRTPWDPADGASARFGLPAVPIVAALVALGIRNLVRPRLWAVPVAVLGIVGGHVAVTDAWQAIAERAVMAEAGRALRPHVEAEDGLVVAVVALPERPLGPRRQWELVARLTADWPPELRQRFWAYREGGGPLLHYREEARRLFGERAGCVPPAEVEARIHIVARRGPLARLLRVAPSAGGGARVEHYCLPAGKALTTTRTPLRSDG